MKRKKRKQEEEKEKEKEKKEKGKKEKKNNMGPRANFNLVLVPPESDSLVTQVDIWGVRCAEGGARAQNFPRHSGG